MLTLENRKLLVTVTEGRGARVESFLDKETERDWVWTHGPEHFDRDAELGPSANFDDAWAGGWDEVFPNDSSVGFEKYQLSDHGELWRRPWKRIDAGENPLQLSFKLECLSYPMSCTKTFRLDPEEARLSVDYEIKNLCDKKMPFIFKLHPAIKIEEGDRFLMPPSTMVPVALPFSRILGKDLETTFPVGLSYEGKRVTIDEVKPNDGFSRDFVRLQNFEQGFAGIYSARGQRKFSLKFNPEDFPYIWLFQSYGGFRGHYVAMIEPSNAMGWDIVRCLEENTCGSLKPQELKRFHLEYSIDAL